MKAIWMTGERTSEGSSMGVCRSDKGMVLPRKDGFALSYDVGASRNNGEGNSGEASVLQAVFGGPNAGQNVRRARCPGNLHSGCAFRVPEGHVPHREYVATVGHNYFPAYDWPGTKWRLLSVSFKDGLNI